MKKRGSITVFLTLIFILLFSLVLTTLEAARITGAQAYVQMLSCMAGDSAKAMYYYPLFEQYGLLGILAEDDAGYFSEEKIEKGLKEDLSYALTGLKGGLLAFSEPSILVSGTKTMLTADAESFLEQIKIQATLECVGDALLGVISDGSFSEAVAVGQIQKKQEEALSQTATVTQEILRLMELIDGVKTDQNGLCFDKEGHLRTSTVFIKRICALTEEEREEQYKNKEVYEAVKENFYSPKEQADELLNLLKQGAECQAELAVYDIELAGYKNRQKEIAKKLKQKLSDEEKEELRAEEEVLAQRREEVTEKRDELIEWLDIATMDMEEQYMELRQELTCVEPLLNEALEILIVLESKQLGAKLSVEAYEELLKEVKDELSDELYKAFGQELTRMKLYAGLDESGCQVPVMRATIEGDLRLLEELKLPVFSAENLYEHVRAVEKVSERIDEYSVEGLWLPYGTIVVQPSVKGNVFEMLKKVTTGGILSLAGVSKESVSERYLAGGALPSAGYCSESLQTDLISCFEEISALFQEQGVAGFFKEGVSYSADVLALEWFAQKYFGYFGEVKSNSKLDYEREYLLFGEKSDRSNLFYSVLYLVAVRTLFAMTSILKDTVKMGQIEALALSLAGFTGVPALVSVLKYGLLLLWSVEEAFIEAAMLLDGKKVPLLGLGGQLELTEIFTFGEKMVEKKAAAKESPVGLRYRDYLLVLSLLKGVKIKTYRSMDLIQETMRYRYNDGFRMKNVVTEISFRVETVLEQKIQTTVWREDRYRILVEEAVAY